MKKGFFWLMAMALMAHHGQAAAAQSCGLIFPTTLSAHDPDSNLQFYGGWVSGNQGNEMRARTKFDLSLLPLSCDNASCSVSGQASTELTLPTFLTTSSSSTLSVGWFGNTTYQGNIRDYNQLKVGWLGRLRVAPVEQTWRIKNITIENSAVLELAPGDYWVEDLSLGVDSKIQPVGNGTVRLFVKNSFSAPWHTEINMDDGANPSRLVIVSWEDIRFYDGADVAATLYAANNLFLDEFVGVIGDIAASEIELQWLSHVTAMSSTQREETDYGDICSVIDDLDGDGIPDSIDNDIDGDGFDNLDEVAAGTDPQDANDYPDAVPPTLLISLPQPYQQQSVVLSINGTVSDGGGPHAGLASVTAMNTTAGQTVAATVNGEHYSAQLQLDFGDNQIAVMAVDNSGNETIVTVIATRIDAVAPSIVLDGLADEAVETATYTLTGTVSDGEDGSGVSGIEVINQSLPASDNTEIEVLLEGDLFTAHVPLVFGSNSIVVVAADGFQLEGTASKTVTRVDTVAPTITLTTPPNQTVPVPQVMVTGSVADNDLGSGVASLALTSDRSGVPAQSLVIQVGGAFSASIDILAGDNQLTLVAVDQFGNQSAVTFTVTRPDLDGDGIADDVDPDRDNDGVSNDDEIIAGTNPDDVNDYPDSVAPTLTTTLIDNMQQEMPDLVVSGNVTDEGGPHAGVASVTLTNVLTGVTRDVTVSAETWQVTVALAFGNNVLNISAGDTSDNVTTLTRTVVRHDVTPPQLILEGESALSIESPTYTLHGSANDGGYGQGVQTIAVENDQSSGDVVTVNRSGDQFDALVPLVFGANTLTVTVTDGQGLITIGQKIVMRIDTAPPTIALSIPAAQQISAPSAVISGSVIDNVEGSGVATAVLTRDTSAPPLPLVLSADGSFTTSVSLNAGANNFTVTATDQSGNSATANFAITRPDLDADGIADDVDPDRDGDGYSNEDEIERGTNPDDAADFPDDVSPTLTLNNAGGQNTTANQITLTGSASDDRTLSAVSAYSEQYSTSFAVTLDGNGNFSASLPLKIGDNTFSITATDSWDNSTTVTITVRRLSPPTLQSVTPASGSVIDASSVAITGRIVTELDAELLRLSVNNAQIVFAARDGNGYPFAVQLPLSFGVNNFALRVSSPDGNDATMLAISRLPENPDSIAVPSLTLLAPNNSQWLAGDVVNVVGRATSYAGALSVTVNGAPVNVTGDGTSGSFSTALYFAAGQTDMTIQVVATDQLGRQTSESVSVQRDISAPMISLDNNFEPFPADNAVTESRLVLSGIVSDSNLSGMLIDTTSPTLTPTGQPGVFAFSRDISLSGGSREIMLSAHDDAGNIALQRYQVSLDPAALLTPILPVDGSRFRANGAPVMVQVAARLAGIASGASAQVLVNGTPYPVNLTDTLLSGEVALPAQSGRVTLRYEVRHPQSGLIAATEIYVEVIDQAAQPLRLDAVTPNVNSQNVSANQLVTLFFNKAIDPAQLSVAVKETLHGYTYVNSDPPGTDFVRAKGYELEEVHRDLELVPGTLDIAPGARMVSFKPDRFFGYGASIFLEVTYAGESLGRVLFTTESLPTQLTGVLTDQFGQPAGGVTVALGDITSVTGKAGGFSFGFDEAQRGLKGGTYDLSVNPNSKDPRFGTRMRSVYLDQGRYKKLATMIVPLLNENTGFDVLQSGLISSLAGGVVEVDLLDASINDQRGRTTVQVNTQLVEPFSLGFDAHGSAPMFGMFALQPEGLEVSGNPRITLPVPSVDGAEDMFVNDAVFFVMGLNADRSAMEPVAVVAVVGGRAVMQGTWHGKWLDYLGLGPIPPEANAAVEQFLQSSGSWATVRRAVGLQ